MLREHIVFNVKLVDVRKMSELFEQNCIVKRVIFFASFFLLALRLSAKKSEIKKNSDDIHWNVWTNIKALYARNNTFKKRIPNMRFLDHLYFGPNFHFSWTVLGCFSSSVNLCG